MSDSANDNATARRCPICNKPALERYTPFCSKRCADVDLGRWLKGSYAVPAQDVDDPDLDEDAVPGDRDEGVREH
jgi:endogenous inhibitor of DNA gyrase (YacG/DUF329 family)